MKIKFLKSARRLLEVLENTLADEREIAVIRGSLGHNQQLLSMNGVLEERIKEIEAANYKIVDLACELEDRNYGLSRAVDRLQALYNMGLAINATMDLPTLLTLISRNAVETLNARVGYILMCNAATGNMTLSGAIGLSEDFDTRQDIHLVAGGVSHWVVENKQPLLLGNIDQMPEISRMSRLGIVFESVVCAPLTDHQEVFGTITIANPGDGSVFNRSDLDLLATIATQASVAIRNARLYEEQQHTYLSTVQAMVTAIEASDAYTRGHSERVTRYSLTLARHMGLDETQLSDLEQAGILHDIGKIGIDINLLHKKEQLSPADVDVLKRHPSIGVRILEPIKFLAPVLDIIEQHHERYDGQGYPHGLAGDAWRLEAKILSVCDTYDAMTSDRPYRDALAHELALREIRTHAGTQFDPEVAAAFLDLCNQGLLS